MTVPQNKHLIVIAGPTAVGKTSFAIDLALRLNTEIISCDSRQLYKELNIGVARPSVAELKQVKHHFIASHSIHDEYNAGRFEQEVLTVLDELFRAHDVVVMTGGTGLYIKAVCEGLDKLPTKNEALRQELQNIMTNEGMDALIEVAETKGVQHSAIKEMNPQRLIRAIEIAESKENTPVEEKAARPFKSHLYFLNRQRQELYDRINKRVDIMMDSGLENEARAVFEFKENNALQTVGYKELFSYFQDECSLDFAIDKIKQHSRNYAKRQLTWFRNQGFTEIMHPFDLASVEVPTSK